MMYVNYTSQMIVLTGFFDGTFLGETTTKLFKRDRIK